MTLEQQWQVVGWGSLFIQLGLPILLMLVPKQACGVSFGLFKVLLSTFVCWLLANGYRMNIELPICLAHAKARGNDKYDGVGANTIVFILGWVVPFILSMVVWGIGKNQMKRPTSMQA